MEQPRPLDATGPGLERWARSIVDTVGTGLPDTTATRQRDGRAVVLRRGGRTVRLTVTTHAYRVEFVDDDGTASSQECDVFLGYRRALQLSDAVFAFLSS